MTGTAVIWLREVDGAGVPQTPEIKLVNRAFIRNKRPIEGTFRQNGQSLPFKLTRENNSLKRLAEQLEKTASRPVSIISSLTHETFFNQMAYKSGDKS
ncbi:DUF3923 family protein [Lentibacillus kimchii]|uniref:DUF3923 family protein n=1 Tax=Lentibacillus kimchii TaxID=1542911 RepID=A0ABW2UTH9_9BACI